MNEATTTANVGKYDVPVLPMKRRPKPRLLITGGMTMPADKWHHATVRDKKDFIKDSYGTITLKGVEGIQLTSGKLTKDGKGGPMTAQRYLFDRDAWTEKKAKDWLKKHKVKTIAFDVAQIKEVKESMNVGGDFEQIWKKITEQKGQLASEQKVVMSSEGEGWTMKGSFEDIRQAVQTALRESGDYGDYPQIIATYSDKVYVEAWISPNGNKGPGSNLKYTPDEKKYFEVLYDVDLENDEIVLGDSTELTKRTQFLIKEQSEYILNKLFRVEADQIFEALSGVNNLPDSSFGFIESGGEKDDQGKTTPRSLRHYPMKDKDGNWSKGNVTNALTRLNQATKSSSPWMTDAAKAKILKMIKAGYKALEMDFPEE